MPDLMRSQIKRPNGSLRPGGIMSSGYKMIIILTILMSTAYAVDICDRSDLRFSDLRGRDLSGASLNQSDLTGADLRGANLNGAYLRSAWLVNANLEGASLAGADLSMADLSGANLSGTARISPGPSSGTRGLVVQVW
ncbi:pentapeptide repeat-containing protein [Methanothrix sp.]|uniref:pentapeptide repeat-containing protein n=1 Tax=Methanothrix sp. TaxID=90426 RepID=UPI00338DD536|nr:pentapeptide repeat-containing protein [Methanothrix sp.]